MGDNDIGIRGSRESSKSQPLRSVSWNQASPRPSRRGFRCPGNHSHERSRVLIIDVAEAEHVDAIGPVADLNTVLVAGNDGHPDPFGRIAGERHDDGSCVEAVDPLKI
jgi:hypothetical protein